MAVKGSFYCNCNRCGRKLPHYNITLEERKRITICYICFREYKSVIQDWVESGKR